MERMTFYIDGEEKAWVLIDPSQKENMERMMEMVARYIAPCGINLQFVTEVETEITETDEHYDPYKVTVESILDMFNRFDPIMTDKQDFIDNIRVKCKDAVEYEELKNQMLK